MTDAVLRHGAATDVGAVRELNEDAYLVAPPVFVVADGMGGHDHGDVASRFAVEELAVLGGRTYDAGSAVAAVADALAAVHTRIDAYDAAQHAAGDPLFSAGTTAVVAVLVEDPAPRWLLANLGDSRAYRLTEGRLEQVTVDHSLVQELVDAGTLPAGAAAGHPDRHVVTRGLGGPVRHEADFYSLPAAPGERLLLCSDGVNEMLADADIAGVLLAADDPAEAAAALVGAAVAAGGRDNATAVVVDVVGLGAHSPERSTDAGVVQPGPERETGAHP